MKNQSKTRLEQIREQLAQKMTRAIVEAIEDGAKIEAGYMGVVVDGVFLAKSDRSAKPSIVLHLNAPEIDVLFEPSRDELSKRKKELQNELNQIELKLKEL